MEIKNEFQLKRALANFKKRKKSAPKRINNADLPAGSPMYYYCIYCGVETGVTAETSWSRPPRICEQCQPLVDLGEI